jgi:hypothetical protein
MRRRILWSSNEKNALLFNNFLEYYKPRVSAGAFLTIKTLSKTLITWFDTNGIIISEAGIQDVRGYKKSLYEQGLCTGSI